MVVTVLGMHRSGTSVVTRMMNLLGVSLGPEGCLRKSRADNPTGFWEHGGFIEINNDLLRCLGGTWRNLPSFPTGWETSHELDPIRERVKALVQRDFSNVLLWGWKDPATSLLLPFYKLLFPSLRTILCLRNPFDTALSLQRRDGFSLEEGVEQWLLFVLSGWKNASGTPHIQVQYEDVIGNASSVLNKLGDFLGCRDRAFRLDTQLQLRDLINPGLRHFHTSKADALKLKLASNIVISVWDAFECLSQSDGGFSAEGERLLNEALRIVGPPAARRRREANVKWKLMSKSAVDQISTLVPEEQALILVDDNELGRDFIPNRSTFLFLEEDGQFSGPPPDEATAIAEVVRLQDAGAQFLVFVWPAFWWLEHFSQFITYLRTSYRCVIDNDCLVVFQLNHDSAVK